MEQVLPHSKLKKLSDDLWMVEGTLPHNNPLPRNMVIFRTPERNLWIHSPVAVDNQTQKEIEALGYPKWIVVPNEMHRLDAGKWKTAFWYAQVVCPKAAKAKVEDKIKVDAVCEDLFKKSPITALPMAGVSRNELAYELELKSGKALIVNDLLVNIENLPGFMGKAIKFFGRIGRFRVPKPQRLLFLYHRKMFKSWLQKMANKDFTIVTVSHGDPVTSDVSLWLRSAAEDLLH